MVLHELPLPQRRPQRLREFAAAVLRAASRALDGLALALVVERPQRSTESVVEFHAEAGAPEGALYIDGEWVGNVLGVTRL